MKTLFAAAVAATALMTAAAVAQTAPAPAAGSSAPAASASSGGSGGANRATTQMNREHFRVSKLMGVDVYGSDDDKIGDIEELVVDKQGKIHMIVVGVGGFLGIGEKNVAIPYDQVTWMTQREVQAMSNRTASSGAAGQPATTGATGATGTTAPAGAPAGTPAAGTAAAGNPGVTAAAGASDDNTPARAKVKMAKADLQNAPEFRYSNEANRTTTTGAGAGGTNPPAAANRPGNAPAQ